MLLKSCLNCTWRDCAASQAHFVLDKNVSLVWFRCGNFDNRTGASFEPNHVVTMEQCSPVDSQLTSRNISFAGRSAVAGKSEKKT